MLLSSTFALRPESPRIFCPATGTLSLLCAFLIGSIRLDSTRAADDTPVARSNEPQNDGARQASEKQSGNESRAGSQFIFVRGNVLDNAGTPISGARLWLPLHFNPRRVVEGTTDESGRFELKFPTEWVSPQIRGSGWTIWAYARGHGIATVSPFQEVRGKSEKEVEIQLPAEANTRFKVLAPDGVPVRGAVVQPQNYRTKVGYDVVPEEMLSVIESRTDAEGFVTLPAIPSQPLYRIQIEHEKFGKQSFRVGREALVHELKLRETGKIEGRVVGERSEWLRGVRLRFATDNADDEWPEPTGHAEATTDDSGRFEVPMIAGGGPLHTYLTLDPSLPVRPRLQDNLYVPPGETLQLEIPLVAAPKVFGKIVTKSTRKPVANAEMSLSYGGFRQGDDAVTDENGRFEGRALPGPVRMHIIVMPNGYDVLSNPWEGAHELPAGVEKFELPTIEVVETHQLSGQLIDGHGKPLAAIELVAVDGGRDGFATTDSDGRFTMRVPDGVETRIEVYTDERRREPVAVVQQNPLVLRYLASAREPDFDASRQAKADVTLTGRVLLGEEPLAGVKLKLNRMVPEKSRVDPKSKVSTRETTAMRMKEIAIVETDTDGRYRLNGLKAGDSYQIEVRPAFPAADPAWHHQLPYVPNVPDEATGELELPELMLSKLTQSLAGTVVDPEGNPVEGAQVSAMLRDGFSSIPRTSSSGPPPWTETDRQGRFKLQQLPDKPLALMAYIKQKAGGRIRYPAKVNVERNQQDIRIILDPSLEQEDE